MNKSHGERYTKRFSLNGGKTVYFKVIRFCAVHGEIDLFLCRNWDAEHRDCPNKPGQGAAVAIPKAMRKAA